MRAKCRTRGYESWVLLLGKTALGGLVNLWGLRLDGRMHPCAFHNGDGGKPLRRSPVVVPSP